MRIRIHFGIHEVPREATWWQPITSFPVLVEYKGRKWEFISYDSDPQCKVDLDCFFSEVPSYDPNWHATTYENIDHLFGIGYGSNCECGAEAVGSTRHSTWCKKWRSWSNI